MRRTANLMDRKVPVPSFHRLNFQQAVRETFGSLRLRLTLWNTAVVLLLVVFTLWGVREGLRFILWHEADEQLVEDAREVALTYEQLYPDEAKIEDELNRKAITHTHRGLHMRIFDQQRRLIFTGAIHSIPRKTTQNDSQ